MRHLYEKSLQFLVAVFCVCDGFITLCLLPRPSSWNLNSLRDDGFSKGGGSVRKEMGRGVFIPQRIVNIPLVIQVAKLCLKLGLASVLV